MSITFLLHTIPTKPMAIGAGAGRYGRRYRNKRFRVRCDFTTGEPSTIPYVHIRGARKTKKMRIQSHLDGVRQRHNIQNKAISNPIKPLKPSKPFRRTHREQVRMRLSAVVLLEQVWIPIRPGAPSAFMGMTLWARMILGAGMTLGARGTG